MHAPAVLDPPTIGRLEPLRPLPVNDVRRAMTEYQEGLHAVLDGGDWQQFADRDGRTHDFVKRSGWRKVATWFGLDLVVASTIVERVTARLCPKCGHSWLDGHEGDPTRALVTGRAVAPNGRVAEDVGACSITERTFSKPEHDLIATATTRALNRATSNLVGMGELSAEEVDEQQQPAASLLPEWAHAADAQLLETMHAKLRELVGEYRTGVFVHAVHERYGYTPNIATGFVNALHSMLAPELARARGATQPTTSE